MFPTDPDGNHVLIPTGGFTGDCMALNSTQASLHCKANPDFSGTTYIKTAALVGAVLGQLVFGALADKLGRRVIFVCTISMVILGAVGSALVQGGREDGGIYVQLTIFRFILGVGVGGEYPLSATVSSESTKTAERGSAVSNVFAMQGWGNVTAGLLSWALLAAGVELEIVWRVCLGFGAVPGLLTVYWRWCMEETEAFQKAEHGTDRGVGLLEDEARAHGGLLNHDKGGSAGAASAGGHPGHEDPRSTSCCAHVASTCSLLYAYRFLLLGTAGSWFIFDVTFYANGLFSDTVFDLITPNPPLAQVAADVLYSALLGLPGYYLGVYFIDRMGRRAMQIFGFAAVGIVFLVMAGLLEPLKEGAVFMLVILYGLTFLFANWGPNTTTYVIPSEVFPTRARATCHGISAASGKMGAVVGSYGIGKLETLGGSNKDLSLRYVLVTCGLISVSGALWSMAFTPNMEGVSMDDIDAGAALEYMKTGHTMVHDDVEGGGMELGMEDSGRMGSLAAGGTISY